MQGGKWEARLGQSRNRKHSYLGLFDSEEDAAKAYDTATITRFGHGVALNFDIADVRLWLESTLSLDTVQCMTKCFSAPADCQKLLLPCC